MLVYVDGPKVSDQIFEGHPPVFKKFIQLDVGWPQLAKAWLEEFIVMLAESLAELLTLVHNCIVDNNFLHKTPIIDQQNLIQDFFTQIIAANPSEQFAKQ